LQPKARRRIVVAGIASILLSLSTTAQAQIPGFPGGAPPPVPGAAPMRLNGSAGVAPGGDPRVETLPDGTVVRRYTEEEMNGHFEGRVADEYQIPPGCDGVDARVWYGYISADVLYWDRVRSDSANFVEFAGNNERALGGQDFLWNDLEIVPRVTAGIATDRGWGFEAAAIWEDDLDTHEDANAFLDLNMNAFGEPGPAFAPNFFVLDTVIATRSTEIHSLEAHWRQYDTYLNFMAGLRYIELNDLLWIDNYRGGAFLSYTSIETENKLYGLQIGVESSQVSGVYGYEFYAKAGYYLNSADSRTQIANAGVGLPDQIREFNDGRADAFVADGQFAFFYNPYIWWRLKLGWNGIILMQTALANDQVFNSNDTGFVMHQRGDVIFHGPFASSEVRW
jgi:hypothetical protein